MSFAPKHLRLPLSKMAGCPWNLIDHRGVRIVWCAPGDHERDGENIADDLLKLVAIGEAAGELLEIRHRKMAEKDAEIELLRGDLKGAELRWHLACEDIAKRDAEIERLKATIAASDERLQKAAERVGIMFGCDSADWMADRIDELWQTFETTANQLLDLKRDTDARIEFLEKALEQATEIVVRLGRDIYPDVTNQRYTCFDEWDDDNQCWGCGYTESPELAAYLREREGKEEAI